MGRPGCRSCCGTVREYPPECLTPVGVDYYDFGDGFKDVEDYIQYLLEQGERGLFNLNAHKKVLAKNNTHEYKSTVSPFAPQYVKLPDSWTEIYNLAEAGTPLPNSYRNFIADLILNTPWQETQSSFFSGSSDLGVLVPLKWSVNFSGGYQLISEIVGFDTTTHSLEPTTGGAAVNVNFDWGTGRAMGRGRGFDVMDVYDFHSVGGGLDLEPGVFQGASAADLDYLNSVTSANMRIEIERQGFNFLKFDINGTLRQSYFTPYLRKTKTKDNIVWTRTLLAPSGEVLYTQKNRVPYKEIVDIYGWQQRDAFDGGLTDTSEQYMYRVTKNNCYLPIPMFLGNPTPGNMARTGSYLQRLSSDSYYVSPHMMNNSLFEYSSTTARWGNAGFSLPPGGLTDFDFNASVGHARHPAVGLGLAGYLACTYCLGHNFSIMNYYHAEYFEADYTAPDVSYEDFTGSVDQTAAELRSLDTADPKSLFGHTIYSGIASDAFRTAEVVTEGWALLNPYSQTLTPFDALNDVDRKSNIDIKPPMVYSVKIDRGSAPAIGAYVDRDENVRLTPTDKDFDREEIEDYPILTDEETARFPVSGWELNNQIQAGLAGFPAANFPKLGYDETAEIWQELWKIKFRGMARYLLSYINFNANIANYKLEDTSGWRNYNGGYGGGGYAPLYSLQFLTGRKYNMGSQYATKLARILTPDQLLTRGLNSTALLPHTIEMQRPELTPMNEWYGAATKGMTNTENIKYVAKVSEDVAYGLKRQEIVTTSNTTQLCFISTDNYPAVRSAQVIRHSTNLNYDGALSWDKLSTGRYGVTEAMYSDMKKLIYQRIREEPGFKLWGEALGILAFDAKDRGYSSDNEMPQFLDTDPEIISNWARDDKTRLTVFPPSTRTYSLDTDDLLLGVESYGEYYHLAPVQVPIAGGSQIIGIGNKDLTVGDMVVPTDRPAEDTSLWVITQVKATKKDEDEVYYIRKLSDPEEGTTISEKNVVRPDKEYQQGFYWSSLGVLNMQAKYLNGEHADPTMYRVTNIELFAAGASVSITRPGAIRFYSIGGTLDEEGAVRNGSTPPDKWFLPSYANNTYPKLPFDTEWHADRLATGRSVSGKREEHEKFLELIDQYKNSSWNEYITISPQMSVGISEFPDPFNAAGELNRVSTEQLAYDPEATFTVFFSPQAGKSVKHTCAFPYDPTKEAPQRGYEYEDGSVPIHGPTIHYEAKVFPNNTLPSEILQGDGYKMCYNSLNRNSWVPADRFDAQNRPKQKDGKWRGREARGEAEAYMWHAEMVDQEKYGSSSSSSTEYGIFRRVREFGGPCDRATSGIIVQNGVYFNLTDDIQIKFTLEPVGGNNPELEKRRKVGVDMNLPQALRAGRKNPTLEEDKDNPLLIGVFDPPDPELDHTAGLKIPKVGGGHITLPVNLWQGHTPKENHERQKILGCIKMPDYTAYEVETGGLPEEIIKNIPPSEVKKSTFQDFNEAIDTLNGNSIIVTDEPSPIWTSVPVDLGKISNADLDQLTVNGLNGPKLDYSNQIDRLNEERSDNTETLPDINPETKLEIGTEVYVAFPTMWSITAQAQNPYPEGLYGVRSPYSKLPDVLDYRYFAYAEYRGKLYPVLKGIILKVASISTEEEIDSNANQDQVLDRISLTNGAKHILEFSRSEDYGWGTKVEDLWTGTQNLLPESYEGERKSYINFYKEMPQAGFFHVPAGGSAWAQLFPVDKCEILNPKDNV